MKFQLLSRRQRLIQLITLAVSLALFAGLFIYAIQGRSTYDDSAIGITYERAKVVDVLADNTAEDPETENVRRGSQTLLLRILSGRYEGEEITTENYLSAFYNVYAAPGDTVAVAVNTVQEGVYNVSVYNYHRSIWLWVFVALFVAVLVAVGGRQGIRAVLGLGITVFGIIFLLVPLIVQRGWPPIPTTLAVVAYTTFVSFVILGGVQTKTMVAALGSFGGVLLAGLLAWGACQVVHVSGMNMDEAETLLLTACDNGLKIKGLLICGILIAAQGAVMDIAMSISSAVQEIHTVDPALKAEELFRSGMNIGRDAMGTMANTLILAFAGGSLNMIIFIYAYDVSYVQLMNTDFVAIELIRGLAGSIGIILTVPLVALLSACILGAKKGKGKGKGRKGVRV